MYQFSECRLGARQVTEERKAAWRQSGIKEAAVTGETLRRKF